MGTSPLKSAALLGALFIATSPAHSAGMVTGAPVTPAIGTPSTSSGLASSGLSQSGTAAANQGMVGGLTASQQSFLMNFASPTQSARSSEILTPAEQMQMNADANSDAAIRNGTGMSLSPTLPGASASGTVANNSGTLAETAQSGAP